MEFVFKILIGFIFAFVLHELTHLLVIVYYKIPLTAIVMTKWTTFGFLVDNETYVHDEKKLFLIYFLPLIWCILIFINPNEPYLLMFPLVNIFGGIGDMYNYFRIVSLPADKRIEWANKSNEKLLKSIVWKKEL
jgi:hypothetical protein